MALTIVQLVHLIWIVVKVSGKLVLKFNSKYKMEHLCNHVLMSPSYVKYFKQSPKETKARTGFLFLLMIITHNNYCF